MLAQPVHQKLLPTRYRLAALSLWPAACATLSCCKLGTAGPQHSPYALLAFLPSPVGATPAGLVFFAFGLNMVDCGGLLGGRLGKDAQKVVKARADPGIGRTMTL